MGLINVYEVRGFYGDSGLRADSTIQSLAFRALRNATQVCLGVYYILLIFCWEEFRQHGHLGQNLAASLSGACLDLATL